MLFLVWVGYGSYAVYFAETECHVTAPAIYHFTRMLMFCYWIIIGAVVTMIIISKVKSKLNQSEEDRVKEERRKQIAKGKKSTNVLQKYGIIFAMNIVVISSLGQILFLTVAEKDCDMPIEFWNWVFVILVLAIVVTFMFLQLKRTQVNERISSYFKWSPVIFIVWLAIGSWMVFLAQTDCGTENKGVYDFTRTICAFY